MDSQMLPSFELPDRQGHAFRPEMLKQQQELVVAITHGSGCSECERFLERLGRAMRDASQAQTLVVCSGDEDEHWLADLPAEVLRDPDRHVCRQICTAAGTADEPLVLAADRFGELKAARAIHGADPDDPAAEMRDWVEFLQEQCPECGVPTW